MVQKLRKFEQSTRLVFNELADVSRRMFAGRSIAPYAAPEVCQLEDRVLLSASPVAIATETAADLLEPADDTAGTSDGGSTQPSTTTQSEQQRRTELVFVDPAAADYEQLVNGLRDDENVDFQVHVLDASRDGVEEISAILSEQKDVDGVHIVSHGVDGAVKLGDTWLNGDSLHAYSELVSGWNAAFSADADLLFYGCDLAASQDGRDLLDRLSELTEADVAASVDDTGNANLGGDWDLEHAAGDIQTSIAFHADTQDGWAGILSGSPPTISTTPGVLTYTEGDGRVLVDPGMTVTDLEDPDLLSATVRILLNHTSPEDMLYFTNQLGISGSYSTATGILNLTGLSSVANYQTALRSVEYENTSINPNTAPRAFSFSAFDGTSNGSGTRNGTVSSVGPLTVDTTSDTLDGDTTDLTSLLADKGPDGRVSLREAIIASNGTAGADSFSLPAGDYWLTRIGSEDAGLWGDLDIRDDLTINGADAKTTVVDGIGLSRVFDIFNSSTASLNNLTVQGGVHGMHGGGLFVENFATLNLTDVELTGNSSPRGGAVHVHGTLNLDSVSLYGNSSTIEGGALHFHAPDGGSLTNVTISGNTTANGGGAIFTDAAITVTNTTIYNNTSTATGAGGIHVSAGNATLKNTILAYNPGGNTQGNIVSADGNIDSGNTAGLSQPSDQPNTDPLLEPVLNDNGGPTQTHALLTGSPAIDTAVAGAPATDQRGALRNGTADVGAYEYIPGVLVVTTTNDDVDGNTASVWALQLSNGLDGVISLREAITAANNTAGLTEIQFNIPGGGPHTITVGGALPNILRPVLIDGSTEPDYVDAPVVRIHGSGGDIDGLVLDPGSDGSTIRGLAFTGFSGATNGRAVLVRSDGNLIAGNYSGVDTDGSTVIANRVGFEIKSGGSGNLIGGTTAADSNVATGNTYAGVSINGLGADNNQILGNDIGTDATGALTIGNGSFGVVLWNQADGNIIGSVNPGEANTIAGNVEGVLVDTTAIGTTIRGNAIFANTQAGIDLNNDGVTANDLDDVDSGPNTLQNFPVISFATVNGSDLTINASLNSKAGAPFNIDFYASVVGDPSGHGEAERYLGSLPTLTDVAGNSSFGVTYIGIGVAVGEFITATATDASGNTSEFALNVVATGNSSPTDIAPNTFGIDENTNTTGGVSLGALAATDPDTGESFSYSIQPGGDGLLFAIGGAGLDELILDDGVLDFETRASYSVNLRVTDSASNTYDETLTVNVNDRSEPKAIWFGDESSARLQNFGDPSLQFEPAGGTTGTFTPIFDLANFGSTTNLSAIHYVSRDITIGQTTTFDLLTGDLIISQEKGETLTSTTSLAVEKSDVFVFRPDLVGDYSAGRFYMLFDDLGQGNDILALSLVEQDTTVGGTVLNAGSLLFTARNLNARQIYNFDPDDLALSPPTGATTLVLDGNAVNVDFDTNIFGFELVEEPMIVGGTTFGAGELLVTLDNDDGLVGAPGFSTAADKIDVFRLQVVSTTEARADIIFDGSDLALSESIKGLSFIETGVNSAPTDIALSNTTVDENTDTTSGFAVGTLTSADPDAGDTVSYAIQGGADQLRFAIGGAGSDSLILSDGVLDFESKNSYAVIIRATDGGGSTYDEAMTVTVNDLNEAPTAISPASFNVNENTDTTVAFSLGLLSAVDEDSPETFGYAVVGGADQTKFSIGGVGGDELLLSDGILNFEGQASYTVDVRVTDSGGNTFDETITVNVNDLNEPPTAIAPSGFTINENTDTSSGLSLGVLNTTDPDTIETFGYAVIGGADQTKFSIGGVGGDELLLTDGILDFEGQANYTVDVRVTDSGGNIFDETINVDVNDLNEAATDITLSSTTVAENSVGAVVGNLAAIDQDAGDTHTWSVNDFRFEIVAGQLKLRAGQSLDAETEPTVNLTVTATDSGSLPYNELFTVVVSDVNDAPTITSSPTTTVAENQTLALIVAVADADVPAQPIAYSIVGGADQLLFSINGATGELRFVTAPDFENPTDVGADSVYDVQVSVDDGNGGVALQLIQVDVADANDSPISLDQQYSVDSDQTLVVDAPGVLTGATDQDGQPLTSVLVSAPSSGTLTFRPDGSFDYVPAGTFFGDVSFTYAANDGAVSGNVATVTITVDQVLVPLPDFGSVDSNPEPAETPEPDETDSSDTADESTSEDALAPLNSDPSPLRRGRTEATTTTSEEEAAVEPETAWERVTAYFFNDPQSEDKAPTRTRSSQTAATADSGGGVEAFTRRLLLLAQPGVIWESLDTLGEEVDDQFANQTFVTGSVGAATSGLTVGYVVWLLRGGALLSSVLAQMPAWRFMDPTVVLQFVEKTETSVSAGASAEESGEEDESLNAIVERGVADDSTKLNNTENHD